MGLETVEKPNMVELIGGPRCGSQINWPKGKKRAEILYNPKRAEIADEGTVGAVVVFYALEKESTGKAVHEKR